MQSGYLIKVVSIGSTRTGKTNILSRFIDNRFNVEHNLTIGVEFGSKIIEVNGKKIKLQIWDTAGQESFRSITRSYYRGCCIALIIFDVSQRQSFNEAHVFLNELKTMANNPLIFLIGNKSDLLGSREVSTDEAREFCIPEGLHYFECSAKDNIGIDEVFMIAARTVLDNLENGKYSNGLENNGIKEMEFK